MTPKYLAVILSRSGDLGPDFVSSVRCYTENAAYGIRKFLKENVHDSIDVEVFHDPPEGELE